MRNIGILQINEQAEKIPGCIRFDKGSAKFPFPEEFLPLVNKVKQEIRGKYFYYPTIGGEEKLKEQIIKFEKENGRQLSCQDIVITHGGMSGLFNFVNSVANPGDEVITNRYCFEGFSALIDYFKLKQKRVDLSIIEVAEKAITSKTKIIILNSPENPTGKVYSAKEIEDLIKLADEKKIWLLSDEVINKIIYNKTKWFGPTLINEHIVIVNSFSKNWFIPGIRVGWIATKSQWLTESVANFLSLQSTGVNLFGQLLITKILKEIDYKSFLAKRLNVLARRKKLLEKVLKKNKIDYLKPVQGGTNFYVNLKKDSQRVTAELLKRKAALIPGHLFEGKASNYARLGFGAVSEEEILRGIKIIFLYTQSVESNYP